MPRPFRFVPGGRTGQYSVWRGDERFGFVTKNRHYASARGLSAAKVGWTPAMLDGTELPTERSREVAARILWDLHQASFRR